MLYFLRHGESISNIANIFSGQKDDVELTPVGVAQAVLAAEELRSSGVLISRIVASPLIRAQRTARLVSDVIGFDINRIETDSRLSEYDMGDLIGKPRISITSAQLTSAVGAEDPQLFMLRVGCALAEIREFNGNTLVVSHAGVGRVIRCMNEGLSAAGFYDLPAYPNAVVIPL